MGFFTFILQVDIRPFAIRFPKFTFMNIAEKCHHQASFSIKKLVFWGLLFWKPDDRYFFQLILISLTYSYNTKVKKSMDFLVWVGKTRGTLWWPCYVVYSVKFWLTFFMWHSTESDSHSLRERCLLWSRYWKEKESKIPNLFLIPCETEKWNVIRAETTKKLVKKTLLYFLANLANGKISLKRKTENDVKSWSKNWKEEKFAL